MKIFEKHRSQFLNPSELDKFNKAAFKVEVCRIFSNVVMFMSIYKFFTLKTENKHHRRLVLFRLLLLQMGCLTGEYYMSIPKRQMRKDYQQKYLSGMSDQQLDDMLVGSSMQ